MTTDIVLTEKLYALTAQERFVMQAIVERYGDDEVLRWWNILLEEVRYRLTL
jgi:hypothetical protein